MMTNGKLSSVQVQVLTRAEWFDEPSITFANGSLHHDPKVGIPLYGPKSLHTARHKREVHVGFIGTGEAIEHGHRFYQQCAVGVPGEESQLPFPGCQADRGYRCELRFDNRLREPLTRQEVNELLAIRRQRDRFEHLLGLLDGKLKLLSQKDHPLDYIVIMLPEDIYQQCRVADYVDRTQGRIHRDLRRAIKALAMRYRKSTQIVQETTTRLVPTTRKLDHASRIAWNLFTGLYFKADGLPWGPTALQPGTCYVGVSFYRPLGSVSDLRTSVVQAFDESGDGLVLRGHSFTWDEETERRSPHLSADLADALITMVLDRYRKERGHAPQRVVVHKTSRFEDPERSGFEQALSGKTRTYDLLAVHPVNDVRLLRAGGFPPLRGTSFTIGDTSYVYTTGYLHLLDRFPHGHVPSPLAIADHVGDTPLSQLSTEILALTKMNWNSADYAMLMPITLRFSRLVGDILREVPELQAPEPQFKYYM